MVIIITLLDPPDLHFFVSIIMSILIKLRFNRQLNFNLNLKFTLNSYPFIIDIKFLVLHSNMNHKSKGI